MSLPYCSRVGVTSTPSSRQTRPPQTPPSKHMAENLPALPPFPFSILPITGLSGVSPPGTQPMPCISVVLMAQYLNVRKRKLGTIISFRLSISYSMIVRTQVHSPRGIFAWSTQITSNKPSPAAVPLYLCTN